MFETQEGKERMKEYFSSEMNIFGYINYNQHNMYLKIMGEFLEVDGEPPEPSNTIYKNLHIQPLEQLRNKLFAALKIGLILLGILILFINYNIAVANINKKYDVNNDCSNYKDIADEEKYKKLALHDKEMGNKYHGLGVYECYCK